MKKIFTIIILPIIIIGLVYAIWHSIQEPIEFGKLRSQREQVGIERLKDIRTLEVAFKSRYGRFTASIDTLIDFYKNGQITIIKRIGSMDDSLAVAQKQVRRDSIKINVRDTILKRESFNPDSLRIIPFSGGQPIQMKAVIKSVSGVDVPLFEATMPFKSILQGLNKQLIINLVCEREENGRYPGLRVGSIDSPNNNAGNWE
jgi:hypothetical protein